MGLGSWLSNAVRDVGRVASGTVNSVGRVAQGAANAIVNNPVAKLAQQGLEQASKVLKLPQEALKLVTNNPVFDLVSTGVSFVPGIGQVVGAGMGALAAIGAGASLQDIALRSARQALPGQPASGAAFDIAVGLLLKGQRLDAKALEIARNNVPGGPVGKAAFDTAVNIILGKSHSVVDAGLAAAKRAMPNNAAVHAAFDLGSGLARGVGVPAQMIKAVRARVPGGRVGQAAFDSAVLAARSRQLTPELTRVFANRVAPLGAVGQRMAKAVATGVAVRKIQDARKTSTTVLRTVGDFVRRLESRDGQAAQRLRGLVEQGQQGNERANTILRLISVARAALRNSPASRGATSQATASGDDVVGDDPSCWYGYEATEIGADGVEIGDDGAVSGDDVAVGVDPAAQQQNAVAPGFISGFGYCPQDIIGAADWLYHMPYRTSREAETIRDTYASGSTALVTDRSAPRIGNRWFSRQFR